MPRIPTILQEDYSEEQQAFVKNLTGGKRNQRSGENKFYLPDGSLRGPFNPWLFSPVLGNAAQRLGEAARFESKIDPKLRELAILVVAQEWQAQYEWWAHAKIAQEEGLDDRIIDAVKSGERPAFEDEAQAIVYDFAREVSDKHEVSDGLYQKGVALLSQEAVVDLVMLLGYYTLISMTLNVFDVAMPEGEKAPFNK